jgi:hypothetical protein
MTDWADEIAYELEREFRDCWANGEKVSYPRRIAAALRRARQDALEEAAKAAGRPNEDGSWTNSCNCRAVIRALKDKQP